MPKSLYGFIWQESGRQQVWLCLLTLLVVPLSTVPLELQRRIINDALGSGIATYDVYVSDNGGPFTPFAVRSTKTSAPFTGQSGHSYGFYSVATDNVGNEQSVPSTAQASTKVVLPDMQFVIMNLSASSMTAGNSFLFTVQAADQLGNPVSSYSGPSSVTTSVVSSCALTPTSSILTPSLPLLKASPFFRSYRKPAYGAFDSGLS